jgi:hypothetical protein
MHADKRGEMRVKQPFSGLSSLVFFIYLRPSAFICGFNLIFEIAASARRLSLQRRFPHRLWFEQLKQQVDPVKIGGPCWFCQYRNSRID